MKRLTNKMKDQRGFIMVLTLLILIILTLLFISVMNSTFLGIQIASNDRTSGEAGFAAKACSQIKAKEIMAGNAAKLDPAILDSTYTTTTDCETDQPQLALVDNQLAFYQAGIPGGFVLYQLRFNSTGRKQTTLANTTLRNNNIVQRVIQN